MHSGARAVLSGGPAASWMALAMTAGSGIVKAQEQQYVREQRPSLTPGSGVESPRSQFQPSRLRPRRDWL